MNLQKFTELALGFDGAEEKPHFHKSSFQVKGKIFATLDSKAGTVVLKLSVHEQSVFTDLAPGIIVPVKGAWGEKGWTAVDLEGITDDLMKYALTTAYEQVSF